MPLIAIDQSEFSFSFALIAIVSATSSETAPNFFIRFSGTFNNDCLRLLLYEIILPLNTCDEPGIDVIEEERRPPEQDSAKTRDSFLFINSFINTLDKLSSFSPKINLENSFFNFSLTGLIIFLASNSFLALAVSLSLTSPKLAYGATVGFFSFRRLSIFSEIVDSPIPENLRVFEKNIYPSEKLFLI